jgi:hypothetical protein
MSMWVIPGHIPKIMQVDGLMVTERPDRKDERNMIDTTNKGNNSLYIAMPKFEAQGRQSSFFRQKYPERFN